MCRTIRNLRLCLDDYGGEILKVVVTAFATTVIKHDFSYQIISTMALNLVVKCK